MKQYQVRYGQAYKIVIAAVLPSLSLVPFIWLMRFFASSNEWMQYLTIFAFLAAFILFTVWLVLIIYPKAILSVDEKEIKLHFTENTFLKPDDFNVRIGDITYVTPYKIAGNDFIVFKIKNPSRKFQLSAISYNTEEYVGFNTAMNKIRELVNDSKDEQKKINRQ